MRARGIGLILAATALAVLAATGCSGDGRETAGGDAQALPEQDGLEVGTEAPDFRLKNQEQATIALSDYRGTKNVVLVFYPADFTPV